MHKSGCFYSYQLVVILDRMYVFYTICNVHVSYNCEVKIFHFKNKSVECVFFLWFLHIFFSNPVEVVILLSSFPPSFPLSLPHSLPFSPFQAAAISVCQFLAAEVYNPDSNVLPKERNKSKKKPAHPFKKLPPKPAKPQAPPPAPIVTQLMEMGFLRRNIEYAIEVITIGC